MEKLQHLLWIISNLFYLPFFSVFSGTEIPFRVWQPAGEVYARENGHKFAECEPMSDMDLNSTF